MSKYIFHRIITLYIVLIITNNFSFGHPKSNLSDSLKKVGDSLKNKNEFIRSIDIYKRAILVYELEKKQNKIVDLNNSIATSYMKLSENDHAIHFLEKNKTYLESNNDYSTKLASTYNSLGIIYQHKGEYKTGNDFLTKSIDLYFKLEDSIMAANSIVNKGNSFLWQGLLDEALINYYKALDIIEKTNDKIGIANCYNNIGLIYLEIGQFEQALNSCLKSWVLRKETNDSRELLNSEINLGVIYSHLNRDDEAISIYRRILSLEERPEFKPFKTAANTNLGDILISKELYDSARIHLSAALKIAEETNDAQALLSIKKSLGTSYSKSKNYTQAIHVLNEAITLAEKINALTLLTDMLLEVSKLYAIMGHYEQAYKIRASYEAKKDSLQKVQKSRELSLIQNKFEDQQHENKILISEKEKIMERNKYLLFLVCLVSIISILTFFVYNQRQKIKKERELFNLREELLVKELKDTNEDLSVKKKQLNDYVETLIKRNKLAGELDSSLKQLANTTNLSESKLSNLKELFKLKILTDEDWDIFKVHFNNVYPDYLNKVKDTYERLTQAEQRLFILIKLRYSRFEISEILGISTDSVKKARQRLRKKLDIKQDTNLEDYISGF